MVRCLGFEISCFVILTPIRAQRQEHYSEMLGFFFSLSNVYGMLEKHLLCLTASGPSKYIKWCFEKDLKVGS